MNSKIRVEHDFTKNQPFIQLSLEDGDVNDAALKFFVYQANSRGIQMNYATVTDGENKSPRIIISDANERERALVNDFDWICKESVSPESYESLEKIINELRMNRRSFKELL